METDLPDDSPALLLLRQFRRHGSLPAGERFIQLPLQEGREALSLDSRGLHRVELLREGEHPAMNVSEGHLGGYLSARHPNAEKLNATQGDPATYTPELWKWMVTSLSLSSMLDVGCGEGHTAAIFRSLGCRVCGVDGSSRALRDSVIPDAHLIHDYTLGPFSPGADYDLVWSCEFVEHVEPRFVNHFLTTFSAATRYLFMTAAPPGQPGWHHVNCQPESYWIRLLETIGFYYDAALTRSARSKAESGHFARQGLAFTR